MKKISWEKDYPDWQVRKWRILEKVFNSIEFNALVAELRSELKSKRPPRAVVFMIMQTYSLPSGCMEAVEAFISNHDRDSQEFIALIQKEPISYMNYSQKVYGPHDKPKEYFNEVLDEADGDIWSRLQYYTLLAIPPKTTRDEIDLFLDKFFSKEMAPVIKAPLRSDNPEFGMQKRVSSPSELETRIVLMRKDGRTFKEIRDALGQRHTEAALRKIYERAKKRFM